MTHKATIGVLMIVKNEEKHLAACLDTVKDWVDEIVIVDSGSTDNTANIAKLYTDKFYTNENWPGFGKQRQLAQSYMTTTWVVPLDADERVTPELKEEIERAVHKDEKKTAYKINRLSSAFGKCIKHSGWSPDWIVRLYRNDEAAYNDALVHEKVDAPGVTLKKIDGYLLHDTYENLHHYLNKTTGYLKAWTDQREGKKKSGLTTAITHAFASFFKMYFLKLGFLDGKHGFILAWLSTHSTFVKYIDLWLREQQGKNK